MNVLRPDTPAIEALIGFTVAWAAGYAPARRSRLGPAYGVAGALAIACLPALAWIVGLPSLSWLVIGGAALFAGGFAFAGDIAVARVAPAIATVFGLVHGAGFAGPLLEMEIPGRDIVLTLLAFNLGVEAGQLSVLGALGAALWLLGRASVRPPAWAFDATAASLFALGTYWFVARALV
jgi:hypothetical protein